MFIGWPHCLHLKRVPPGGTLESSILYIFLQWGHLISIFMPFYAIVYSGYILYRQFKIKVEKHFYDHREIKPGKENSRKTGSFKDLLYISSKLSSQLIVNKIKKQG
jgi:hypothetical protein